MSNKILLDYLNNDDIEQLHQASITILSKYGIKIEDPQLRNTMHEYGCSIEGERVKIPESLIDKVLKNLKKKIDFVGANGKKVTLQPGTTISHCTGGIPFYLDLQTGKKRAAVLTDLIDSIHLMNKLDELDIPCSYLCPSDVPSNINQLRQCENMFRYCNKPIYGLGISSPKEAKYIAEIFKACANDSKSDSYRGLVGVSPESPLSIPKDISDTLKTVIQANIPVSILAAPVVGISGPMSIAGSVAQMHAEILSMAVLAYIYNPDTPVLYGSRVCYANMRNGNSIWGVPEMGISGGIAAQLARHTGFMADVYGLATSSCTFDAQIGFEKSINALIPSLCGAELISGFGNMASVMLGSLSQLVIDNEIFAMIRQISKGIEVNEDTIAMEVIGNVVEGSNFMQEMHTVQHLRAHDMFTPDLGFASVYGDWERMGSKDIGQRATERAIELMKDEKCEVLDPSMSKELDRIIASASKILI